MVRVPGLRALLVLVPLVAAAIALGAHGIDSKSTLLAFSLVGAAGAVSGWFGARPMEQKLERLAEAARAGAGGDLERSFPADRDDAAGRLGEHLEELRKAFRVRMNTWTDRTEEQERLVQQVNKAISDLRTSLDSQIPAIEETAASIHEMTTSMKQIAQSV